MGIPSAHRKRGYQPDQRKRTLIAAKIFSGPLSFLFPVFQLATLGILTKP